MNRYARHARVRIAKVGGFRTRVIDKQHSAVERFREVMRMLDQGAEADQIVNAQAVLARPPNDPQGTLL